MLKKLVAGEYSLKTTFWGFGVLGFFVFILLTSLTHNTFLQAICPRGRVCSDVNILYFIMTHFIQLLLRGGTIAFYLVLHLIMSGCFGAYMIMVVRSLWKSSQSYSGKKFWVWCAKILLLALVVIGIRTIL